MRTSPGISSESNLVFRWEESKKGYGAAMFGFLLASFFLHALCFYVFQIVYPPAIALLPPPGRVTLISPKTPEGRVLLSWLEAEDPALASTTKPLEREALTIPTVQHAPSYLAYQPALIEPPSLSSDHGIPSAHPPAPVETARARTTATNPNSPTTVRFTGGLEGAKAAELPEVHFTASGEETPASSRFRIAASSKGDIRYCFLEASSGDATLDEQARKYLLLLRVVVDQSEGAEVENGLIWGEAHIEWGNDLASPRTPKRQ